MKIHLISDVHLEFQQTIPEVTATGDVCVCAGDIGLLNDPMKLLQFFEKLFNNFDAVIWVLGNHEYYHMDVVKALDRAKYIEEAMQEEYNFHLLDIRHNTTVVLNGVKFWGTTFWTNMPDWYIKQEVRKGLNDYHVIKYHDKKLHPDDTDRWNQLAVNQVNWNADVIVTHHPPIYVKHPRFQYRKMTHAFYNFNQELENNISEWDGKYWLYGHTHHNAVTELNKTLVVANCLGFEDPYGFQNDCKYDPNLYLEI